MLQIFKRMFPERTARDQSGQKLPAIDQIQENDDVSCFMCADVDESTRREALRALFHKPKFNRRDGLDDYDEDYGLLAQGKARFEDGSHS